jgi:hypothetical protein
LKHERVIATGRAIAPQLAVVALIALACVAAFAFYTSRAPGRDVAWLIEASRRWLEGAVLYRDIIEVNPPLIFYETVALTGADPTPNHFAAGVCVAMASSALWIFRLKDGYTATAALIAMIIGGFADFGQRGHLALIFVLPLLVADKRPTWERIALGLWAFLGVGLKPTLLPIPIAAAACKAFNARSLRPLFALEIVTIVLAGAAYVLLAFLVHPLYFSSIVPIGELVYYVYTAGFRTPFVSISAVVVLIGLSKPRSPLAWAMMAALLNFYLQRAGWSYQMVPAIGLAIFLCLTEASKSALYAALSIGLVGFQLLRVPPKAYSDPIPVDARSVAILCANLWCAYPIAVQRGVRNDTRYPALWTLPGAWDIAGDPTEPAARRGRAEDVLQEQRSIIRGDILRQRPQYILTDARPVKPYFAGRFDYIAFLGPFPGYQKIGRRGIFDIWTLQTAPSRRAKMAGR